MNFVRLAFVLGIPVASFGAMASCSSDPATEGSGNDAGPDVAVTADAADASADVVADVVSDTSLPDTSVPDTNVPDAAPECGDAAACPGARTCCSGRCVDTAKDPSNCGACGVACAAPGQFCNSLACKDTVLANICQSPNATAVKDTLGTDETAIATMGTALSGCTPTVVVRTVIQADVEGDGGLLEMGGRPVLGPGDMLVTAGGSYGQHAVGWLFDHASRVKVVYDQPNASFVQRSNSMVLFSTPQTALTASHDYFLLELVVEPTSGSLTLVVAGFLSPGTAAGAYYVSNVVLPGRAGFDKAYYLVEWTDGNADNLPDANEFTVIGSGK